MSDHESETKQTGEAGTWRAARDEGEWDPDGDPRQGDLLELLELLEGEKA